MKPRDPLLRFWRVDKNRTGRGHDHSRLEKKWSDALRYKVIPVPQERRHTGSVQYACVERSTTTSQSHTREHGAKLRRTVQRRTART